MIEYVVGFLLCENMVALIEKQRPEWQRGRLNGIGGHVEAGETAECAMIREFEEETGRLIPAWQHFCTLTASDNSWTVYFFTARVSRLIELQQPTDEIPRWRLISSLPHMGNRLVDNVRWLVPMAAAQSPVLAVVREK